jgi:hypothetical protein
MEPILYFKITERMQTKPENNKSSNNNCFAITMSDKYPVVIELWIQDFTDEMYRTPLPIQGLEPMLWNQ